MDTIIDVGKAVTNDLQLSYTTAVSALCCRSNRIPLNPLHHIEEPLLPGVCGATGAVFIPAEVPVSARCSEHELLLRAWDGPQSAHQDSPDLIKIDLTLVRAASRRLLVVVLQQLPLQLEEALLPTRLPGCVQGSHH